MNWIQKARDYDSLKIECEYQQNMKEYFMDLRQAWVDTAIYRQRVITSKVRDLAIKSQLVDSLQFEVREKTATVKELAGYLDQYDVLGRQLKFSNGKNHIEIIVGNPITLCINYVNPGDYTDSAISRCSEKDTYDWKTGVIKSLDKLCESAGYSKKSQRDLHKALAKKYPEVFMPKNSLLTL